MDVDVDNDEYEEDILVYVEFEEFTKQPIENYEKAFKIIGLDTDNPILQIGNHLYEGEYANSFGTHVLFEEDEKPKPSIKSIVKSECKKHYKYAMKTEKKLHMKRIFVREKNVEEETTEENNSNRFSQTYEEALQDILKLAENDNSGNKSDETTSF